MLNLSLCRSSPDRSTKSTRSRLLAPKGTRCAPAACRHTISGSLSLPSRGPFHLSLTVLCSIGHLGYLALRGGPRSFPRNSSCVVVLWILPAGLRFRLRGSHPLWLVFPVPFRYRLCRAFLQSEPRGIYTPVWARALPLAATHAFDFSFSSSPYLDVSVQGVPSVSLSFSAHGDGVFRRRVSPFRHPRLIAHLQLPAAFRSLSRLSSAPWCPGIRPVPFFA